MVRIGVLTSSRADFGVYLPLLKSMQSDSDFELKIIAFGSHLSNSQGRTLSEILDHGFSVHFAISSLLSNDDEESIATNVALTMMKFGAFWSNHRSNFDIVLSLGDRYEMFAAVYAGIPFGIKFAHFYGGDTSLGSFDNIYRDSISIASLLHFTSTDQCAFRVRQLTRSTNVFSIGILSLESVTKMKLLSVIEFKEKWAIDLSHSTILITFHPETMNSETNVQHVRVVEELIKWLSVKYQLLITMPNADTMGSLYRRAYCQLASEFNTIKLVESLGVESYFSALANCKMVIGNSSSGISEAPSFGKYFINVGERQTGRELNENVISVAFKMNEITSAVSKVEESPLYKGENIYHRHKSIELIKNQLKMKRS